MIRFALTMMLLMQMTGIVFCQDVKTKNGQEFKSLCHKANGLIGRDLDSAYYYIEKATTIAKDTQFWDAYFLKGLIQYQKKEYINSVTSYRVALNHAKPHLVVYTYPVKI